tara:strand:+ start:262 stop:618 length:357 start_codon:yes stop_codon:yes gene_type:complete
MFKKDAVYFDPLNKKCFTIPFYGKLSGWALSHIISYMILSYLYPKYWYHIFFIGICWEIIEYIFKLLSTEKDSELKFKRTRDTDNNIDYTTWWDSSTKDIVYNSIGIVIGYSMTRILK